MTSAYTLNEDPTWRPGMTQDHSDTKELIRCAYMHAVEVQNACNSYALIQLFARMCPTIKLECKGTDDFNKHPVVIAMLDKLCQLAGIQDFSNQAIFEAHDICAKRASGG